MANFSFGSIANLAANATSKTLAPYQIHDVKFESITEDVVEAKQGPNQGVKFNVLKLRFVGDSGYYEDTVFLPDTTKSHDIEREANQWGTLNPSALDRFKTYVVHVSQAINPEGLAQLRKLAEEGKINSVETLAKVFVKILTNKAGKEGLKLKLVGKVSNGYVNATIPYYCKINKDGIEYVSNNFITDGNDPKAVELKFTKQELAKKEQLESVKPTDMLDNSTNITTLGESDSANVSVNDVPTDLMNALDQL